MPDGGDSNTDPSLTSLSRPLPLTQPQSQELQFDIVVGGQDLIQPPQLNPYLSL